ncbi:polysaccharide deacetylase family protein [Aquabacter spiritensis]|uniref:Chitooligosaccharide deacetylase n=1 Tax=Aquabacter spiritensis TaxID=933073 RepID=A0A4R3LK27_9HYPH|nr:polysaccharide deacetylase family protein [Aquabacter spiritensis]TCT00583.1 peptidoglycan/xylan/chitin deacetylase (PgdA/CDA1 family) [Aquabacter spiritensis]
MTDAASSFPRITKPGRDFRWPGGRHVAVVFNLAYEAWSDGKAPGIGPMGNPLPPGTFDANALSWGSYGAVAGIERLLRILDRNKLTASAMVSGVFAERNPEQVRAIFGAGHEIVAHSYAQDIIPAGLTEAENRDNVVRTTQALAAITGTRPRGWMSPRGTAGLDTMRVLVDEGYAWQGDVLDTDAPYLQTFENGDIVAVPFNMEINDLPHAMRFGRTPAQFLALFDDFLSHTLKVDDGAVMIDVTAHAHCYGRPGGAWAYEAIAQRVAGRDDVYVATRGEIAAHTRASLGL